MGYCRSVNVFTGISFSEVLFAPSRVLLVQSGPFRIISANIDLLWFGITISIQGFCLKDSLFSGVICYGAGNEASQSSGECG